MSQERANTVTDSGVVDVGLRCHRRTDYRWLNRRVACQATMVHKTPIDRHVFLTDRCSGEIAPRRTEPKGTGWLCAFCAAGYGVCLSVEAKAAGEVGRDSINKLTVGMQSQREHQVARGRMAHG